MSENNWREVVVFSVGVLIFAPVLSLSNSTLIYSKFSLSQDCSQSFISDFCSVPEAHPLWAVSCFICHVCTSAEMEIQVVFNPFTYYAQLFISISWLHVKALCWAELMSQPSRQCLRSYRLRLYPTEAGILMDTGYCQELDRLPGVWLLNHVPLSFAFLCLQMSWVSFNIYY